MQVTSIPSPQVQLSDSAALLTELKTLRQTVQTSGQQRFNDWQPQLHRQDFHHSALNLAYYLALRHQDLRLLQAALMPWGLSSLGRIEARVMPNLDAVIATLSAIAAPQITQPQRPSPEDFFEGSRLLQQHTEELFGPANVHRQVRIMVTLPTQAATDYAFVRSLLQAGTNCVRINCAHDSVEQWQAMVNQVRQASRELNLPCKVLMDLGGPKTRTSNVQWPDGKTKLFRGDRILMLTAATDAAPEQVQFCCSIPAILPQLMIGQSVWIDDGKIGTRVIETAAARTDQGVLLEVVHVKPTGAKLKDDKGLNFPDAQLSLDPLTEQDRQDLDFVATHADIVGYSFVQTAADIASLQQELRQHLPNGAAVPAILAKIETPIAVRNLPELIIQAAGQQPFGVMIARGDLAIEIGYQRLAEIQEEILWICEAAHVPVIWATQVLESLVKTGIPSRGEITDAAMAERAECVMLNKGDFVLEAVGILDDVLTRMQAHQLKKTPQLRALQSWSP